MGDQAGDRFLASGGEEALCFEMAMSLDAGNGIQDSATTTVWTIAVEQVAGNPKLAPGSLPVLRLARRDILVGVLLSVLRLGPLHDLERLGDRPSVLVGSSLDVLVTNIRLAHLEVGVHAAAGETHRRRLLVFGAGGSSSR
jgi:hypothetical protein